MARPGRLVNCSLVFLLVIRCTRAPGQRDRSGRLARTRAVPCRAAPLGEPGQARLARLLCSRDNYRIGIGHHTFLTEEAILRRGYLQRAPAARACACVRVSERPRRSTSVSTGRPVVSSRGPTERIDDGSHGARSRETRRSRRVSSPPAVPPRRTARNRGRRRSASETLLILRRAIARRASAPRETRVELMVDRSLAFFYIFIIQLLVTNLIGVLEP